MKAHKTRCFWPYRQSERKAAIKQYAEQLIAERIMPAMHLFDNWRING